MATLQSSKLARYLALVYFALVVYASLYPLTGWQGSGLSPLVFLEERWPRYWTIFDLVINVVAYAPLGFLATLALDRPNHRYLAPLLATVFAVLVSLSMETTQSWLPSRVPSLLDLVCNSVGALLGAVIAWRIGERLFVRIATLEHELLAPVPGAEFGLTLLGLWMITQLSPETILFGTGDLRRIFGDTVAARYQAEHLVQMETFVVGLNLLAVGLLARQLLAPQVFVVPPLFLFIVSALAVRALATAIVVGPAEAFGWLTPGALRGLLAGSVALLLASYLPNGLRTAIASAALLAGTITVNLAPENPYHLDAMTTWRQGHFLNFNGLTRWTSLIWPFIALPFLSRLARRSGR